jgi:hypothetical protein
MTATNRFILAQRPAAACAFAAATAFLALSTAPQSPAATLNYNNPACSSLVVSGTPLAQTVTCVTAGGGGTPGCAPTASPAAPAPGQSTTISANCSNQPTSFVWTGGACLGLTTATCKVTKLKATTVAYTVAGTNGAGTGTAAPISVTWK